MGAASIACAPGIAGIFRFVILRIGNCDFKKIEDTMDKPLYDEMHERRQTRKA
ncbi:hypothetical protein [Flavisolibacter nicotianae]|uniref:hypothetical protein n=1 Tax=Flavisolibacter nicotianae TaxID=2364882 RepID=UPI0013C4CFC1|nr:hypothetical protein [Flavisolibacter nicotianae]